MDGQPSGPPLEILALKTVFNESKYAFYTCRVHTLPDFASRDIYQYYLNNLPQNTIFADWRTRVLELAKSAVSFLENVATDTPNFGVRLLCQDCAKKCEREQYCKNCGYVYENFCEAWATDWVSSLDPPSFSFTACLAWDSDFSWQDVFRFHIHKVCII